ncbi:uncharacterized protein PODANS_2_4150 [Podospora anserina S mat+]|uniref:Podospora anserina S mat+ genomic DNA chromosome 2, supercontig 2 n=1 Tax=Podospora anserina (strain S / ATCC MYA-4624 / DSM 980 / FGSC 10383) TaxID=515849 RepID=B2B5B6_PODAN|nr:uncharacterized protein PODANS_2_4150 [Podospora anserina S mat+]CAP72991.1 unnamed protein product [Podospora anserina S mat+]CDP25391.1 Putative protein of unknown function [Podospora anserina S mat+]
MGFFTRSKKAKKDTPKPPSKHQSSRASGQRQLPPPPPSATPASPHLQHGRPYIPSSPQFQPAGLLPPPSGWEPYQLPYPSPPIIVNQHHYYLGPPPPLPPRDDHSSRSQPSGSNHKLNLDSAVDLAKNLCQEAGITRMFDSALSQSPLSSYGAELVDQSNALLNQVSNQFNDVLTMIDRDHYSSHEKEILAWQPQQPPQSQELVRVSDSSLSEKSMHKPPKRSHKRDHPKGQTTAAATVVSGSIFSKVELYANSRLPMNLQPLKLYVSFFALAPEGAESDAHVDADWRAGTKAMVIKSMPMDYMNTIVFSIRGTATFMDWTVNLKTDPASPSGFLDDPHNLCHSGFLSVARKMVIPVARRLRQLLEEDPNRASYSLLITGHSAGGAVASLLYMHMLSTSKAAESELNIVAGFFKRIHCITFGTPPISLRPLTKPEDYERRPQLRKSLFLSFVNEGDPVARADTAYVKSLLELFVAPAPPAIISSRDAANKKVRTKEKAPSKSSKSSSGPIWKVPPNRLSSAGRIVVLRSGDPKARSKGKKKTVEERLNEGVVAQITSDEQLRGVIWGDPVAHVMRLYAGRIETLAVGAVTGRGY